MLGDALIPFGPHEGRPLGKVGMNDQGLRDLCSLYGVLEVQRLVGLPYDRAFRQALADYLLQPWVGCELRGALDGVGALA